MQSAQRRGAKAVLIFSDPSSLGYTVGNVYPGGPYRPESGMIVLPSCLFHHAKSAGAVSTLTAHAGLQRGSVYMGVGDPLTPSFPADRHGLRLTLEEARDPSDNGTGLGWGLPLIHSIPISAQDAAPIMLQLTKSTHGIPVEQCAATDVVLWVSWP